MKSYKDLQIYQLAFELAERNYHLGMKLFYPEQFETGSQIRCTGQTTRNNIVEGYGRRRYKSDFIKYLVYSPSSLLESLSESEFPDRVHSGTGWHEISVEPDSLGIKISNFISYVENHWKF